MAGGLAGQSPGRKYNVTLSLNAQNPLNHTIYTAPSGDLSPAYRNLPVIVCSTLRPDHGASLFNF